MTRFLLTFETEGRRIRVPFEGAEFAAMMSMFMEFCRDENTFPYVDVQVLTETGVYFSFANCHQIRRANVANKFGVPSGVIRQ